MLIVATVALAAVVGLALGLLGGGGSILLVPLLTYVTGLPTTEAITASLVVVAATSAVSVVGHTRTGRIHWRTGPLFGAAGTAGALVGGLVGGHLPGQLLMNGFDVLMMITAVTMLRGRMSPGASGRVRPAPARIVLIGAGVGLVTGVLGAGGGFLIVPALTLLAGLPISAAVGTSLLVIAMNSAAGLTGHLTAVPIDWTLTGLVTAAAVLGSLMGARLHARVPAERLRHGFGWFVLAMGAFVLIQQAPDHLRAPALLVVAAMGTAAATCSAFVARCPLRPATAPA